MAASISSGEGEAKRHSAPRRLAVSKGFFLGRRGSINERMVMKDPTSLPPLCDRGRQKGWLFVVVVRDGPSLRLADVGSWHDQRKNTIPECRKEVITLSSLKFELLNSQGLFMCMSSDYVLVCPSLSSRFECSNVLRMRARPSFAACHRKPRLCTLEANLCTSSRSQCRNQNQFPLCSVSTMAMCISMFLLQLHVSRSDALHMKGPKSHLMMEDWT